MIYVSPSRFVVPPAPSAWYAPIITSSIPSLLKSPEPTALPERSFAVIPKNVTLAFAGLSTADPLNGPYIMYVSPAPPGLPPAPSAWYAPIIASSIPSLLKSPEPTARPNESLRAVPKNVTLAFAGLSTADPLNGPYIMYVSPALVPLPPAPSAKYAPRIRSSIPSLLKSPEPTPLPDLSVLPPEKVTFAFDKSRTADPLNGPYMMYISPPSVGSDCPSPSAWYAPIITSSIPSLLKSPEPTALPDESEASTPKNVTLAFDRLSTADPLNDPYKIYVSPSPFVVPPAPSAELAPMITSSIPSLLKSPEPTARPDESLASFP